MFEITNEVVYEYYEVGCEYNKTAEILQNPFQICDLGDGADEISG